MLQIACIWMQWTLLCNMSVAMICFAAHFCLPNVWVDVTSVAQQAALHTVNITWRDICVVTSDGVQEEYTMEENLTGMGEFGTGFLTAGQFAINIIFPLLFIRSKGRCKAQPSVNVSI